MIRRFVTAALICLSAHATLLAQSRSLNPTVKVLPRAQGTVPADCDESVAPQAAPRVQVTEIPREPDVRGDMQPPPSRDLRDNLRSAQSAAETNNRDAFKASLVASREIAATYPPGGERTAANETIAVLNDVDRLWEYQFSSPTGAFFDAGAENGALLAMLKKYRGFEDAVRRQTIVDANGTRFYPTRESREFLLRESSQRLAVLGVKTGTTPVARATTPAPAPVTRPAVSTTTPSSQPKTTTAVPKKSTTRKQAAVKSPSTKRPTSTSRSSSTPKKSSKPRTVTKKPVTEPAASSSGVEDLPVASSPVVTTPNDSTPSTSTVATQTIAPITETTASTDPSTTTTSAETPDITSTTTTAAEKQPAGKRNIILPLVLILIGVGVLVVLFRASS